MAEITAIALVGVACYLLGRVRKVGPTVLLLVKERKCSQRLAELLVEKATRNRRLAQRLAEISDLAESDPPPEVIIGQWATNLGYRHGLYDAAVIARAALQHPRRLEEADAVEGTDDEH